MTVAADTMNGAGPNRAKETIQLSRDGIPLVVDIWSAQTPSDLPPVLLIHGWGNSGAYWEGTARALSMYTRVIVPDLPGTGRSLPVPGPQNLYEQVTTLEFLLDVLELDRLHLVGHSMGSAMSILLAKGRQNAVQRLVLTSMCFFLDESQKQFYNMVMKATYFTMLFRPSWLASVPLLPQLAATRYFYRVPDDPELLRQGLLDYLKVDRETAVICGEDAQDDTIPEAAAQIDVPTLLIACRQDPVMPVENVDYTASVFSNCQVRWIDECGHLPMIEKPAEYLALLRHFLQLEDVAIPGAAVEAY